MDLKDVANQSEDFRIGWSEGFSSIIADRGYNLRGKSEEFCKGYKQGVKDVDDSADDAFQAQYSMDG